MKKEIHIISGSSGETCEDYSQWTVVAFSDKGVARAYVNAANRVAEKLDLSYARRSNSYFSDKTDRLKMPRYGRNPYDPQADSGSRYSLTTIEIDPEVSGTGKGRAGTARNGHGDPSEKNTVSKACGVVSQMAKKKTVKKSAVVAEGQAQAAQVAAGKPSPFADGQQAAHDNRPPDYMPYQPGSPEAAEFSKGRDSVATASAASEPAKAPKSRRKAKNAPKGKPAASKGKKKGR